MEIRKFRMGDKVKVRLDSTSPYRGRFGIVQQELPRDSLGAWYMVKFELQGLRAVSSFIERDLEKVSD
jgi:hypothetical protein